MSGMEDVQEHARRFTRNAQWLEEALDTRNVVDAHDLRAALDWEVKARDAELKRTIEIEDASQGPIPLSHASGGSMMCWTSGAITPNIKQMLAIIVGNNNNTTSSEQELHASEDLDEETLPESVKALHQLCQGLMDADTRIVESVKSAPKPHANNNKRKLPTSELAEPGRWRKIGTERPDIMAEARAWITAGDNMAGRRILQLQHAAAPPPSSSQNMNNTKTSYTSAMPSHQQQQGGMALKKPKMSNNNNNNNRPKALSQVTPMQDLRRAQMMNPQGTMMVHSPGNMQDKQGLFTGVMAMSPSMQLPMHAAMQDSVHMQGFHAQSASQVQVNKVPQHTPQHQLTHTPQQQHAYTPQQQLPHTPQQQQQHSYTPQQLSHTPQQQLAYTPQQPRTMQPNVQATPVSQPVYAPSGTYNPPSGTYNAPSGTYNAPSGNFNTQSGMYKPASSDSSITYQNTPGGYK